MAYIGSMMCKANEGYRDNGRKGNIAVGRAPEQPHRHHVDVAWGESEQGLE